MANTLPIENKLNESTMVVNLSKTADIVQISNKIYPLPDWLEKSEDEFHVPCPPNINLGYNLQHTKQLMQARGQDYEPRMQFLGKMEPIWAICPLCQNEIKTNVEK